MTKFIYRGLIVLSIIFFSIGCYKFYKSPYDIRFEIVNTDEEKGRIMLQELESNLTLADRIDSAQNFCAIRDFSMQTGYSDMDEDGLIRTPEQDAECKTLENIVLFQDKNGHYHFTERK